MGQGQIVEFPFRRSPVLEQAAAVIAYFFFKPIYMALSVVLALVLWQNRSPDLVALRWGMISFFLGEAACAVNYFGYRETSYLWEYLHGLGMLVSFGFVTYALLEGIDRRILLLSSPNHRCASLALCGGCIKYGEPSCGLKRGLLRAHAGTSRARLDAGQAPIGRTALTTRSCLARSTTTPTFAYTSNLRTGTVRRRQW